MLRVTKDLTLEDREVEERFVRATGPGGENVRKEATAVELRLDIGASSLSPDTKQRLATLGGKHVTTGGVLVVVSRAFRSQSDNRKAARVRLVALLRRAATAPLARRLTKLRKAVREERVTTKKRHGAVKRSRSRLDVD